MARKAGERAFSLRPRPSRRSTSTTRPSGSRPRALVGPPSSRRRPRPPTAVARSTGRGATPPTRSTRSVSSRIASGRRAARWLLSASYANERAATASPVDIAQRAYSSLSDDDSPRGARAPGRRDRRCLRPGARRRQGARMGRDRPHPRRSAGRHRAGRLGVRGASERSSTSGVTVRPSCWRRGMGQLAAEAGALRSKRAR